MFSQLNRILEVKQSQAFIKNKLKGIEFMNENRSKKGIKELASGIQYREIEDGTGNHPTMDSEVVMHYRGSIIGSDDPDNYQYLNYLTKSHHRR